MSHLSALKVEQDFPVYSSSVPFLSDRFYEVIFARSQAFWEGWEISPDPSSRATFYYLVNARNPSERAPPLGDSLEPERACKLRLFEVFDAQGNVLNREHSALESGDQRPTMSGLVQDRQIHRGVEFTVVDESYLNEFDREEVRNCIQSSADETDGYVSFCLKHRDEQGQLAFLVLLCDVYSGGDGLHSSLTPWTVRDLSTVSGGTLRPAGVR